MKIKRTFRRIVRLDYRHYICIAITLGFLACGLIFTNALPRLAEAVRDLGLSVAYYFCELVTDVNPIRATVTQMPSWQFAPSRFEPLRLLPESWEEFKLLMGDYWSTWATWDNVEEYFAFIGDVMYYFSKALLVIMPLALCLWLWLGRYTSFECTERGKESKPLKRWRRFTFRTENPTANWFRELFAFMSEKHYTVFWTFLWLLYFNVLSLGVGFLAYYLYFIASFDMASLYGQLLKLTVDLAPVVRFIPPLLWTVIGFWVINAICRSHAKAELEHCELKNRGFINERGVVTIVYGPMGVGKTSMLTSMALSEEVNLRDQALEILLECDIMFPSFPWDKLRDEMKVRMEKKELVDVPSIRRWVNDWRRTFALLSPAWCKWWRRQVRKRGLPDVSFGYDFEHYGVDYNDELKITKLYDAIEDYACAYFIYTIETSLIISNYSIRTDAIKEDLGNFPVWNHDFFERDPRLMDAYSRHAHIIDFDMLRLGKRMIEENPNRNAFGFGVYVISEIDKERKNALELKETKIKEDICNQRNDLFNSCLKMSRHACVIANRVFLKIFCDLQRPEDWGAGGREVGEVVYIKEKGDMVALLPFFSPFWLCEGIFKWVKKHFDKFYMEYIYKRSDGTLFVHLLKTLMSKLDNHYRKVNNGLGCQVLDLELESGRMDGEAQQRKFYRMPKKDYSKRYSTNCLSAIFEGDEVNTVSIADFKEYADIMATSAELAMQNSHFQEDIRKMKASL